MRHQWLCKKALFCKCKISQEWMQRTLLAKHNKSLDITMEKHSRIYNSFIMFRCIFSAILSVHISLSWHEQELFPVKGGTISTYSGVPSQRGEIQTSQKAPHISAVRASYGAPIVRLVWRRLTALRRHRTVFCRRYSSTSYFQLHNYYMFVVVNFDALAQASDIRIQRRQVVFLCWKQDSNLEVSRHLIASRLNAHSQTDWAIEDQAKNLNSTARPYDEWAFSPLDFTAAWLYMCIHLYICTRIHAHLHIHSHTYTYSVATSQERVNVSCWL